MLLFKIMACNSDLNNNLNVIYEFPKKPIYHININVDNSNDYNRQYNCVIYEFYHVEQGNIYSIPLKNDLVSMVQMVDVVNQYEPGWFFSKENNGIRGIDGLTALMNVEIDCHNGTSFKFVCFDETKSLLKFAII